MVDVTIIGCGVVGAAVAYELAHYNLNTLVLEKENDVSTGTTKANSAIIHAGYDPEPDTLMARFNVEGNRLVKELCKKLDVPCKEIGSLVLAFTEEETKTVQALYERGVRNGVPDMQVLDGQQVLAIEPNLSKEVKGALLAPTAAVLYPWELCLALAETAVKNGVQLRLNSPVTAIEKTEGGFRITAGGQAVETRAIVNAAGVEAEQINDMVAAHAFTTHPSRGEYYLMDKSQGAIVERVIFQCPNQDGKGVLVAPTVQGNLIVGPNAEPVENGEDVAVTAQGLDFVRAKAAKSVPDISYRDAIRNFAGVRAVTDQPDFIVGESKDAPGLINLAGIKSPGLTSAPAIAKEAVRLLQNAGLALQQKPVFDDTRHRVRFREMSSKERDELVSRNPAYGRVICRCETVTEGEILDALHSPIPPVSVDGVKRRCNPGMGRCQGGFCGPRVLEILARERGVDPQTICQDKEGSEVLVGRTKQEGGAQA